MCTSYLLNISGSIPSSRLWALTHCSAIVADSFITSPRLPVIVRAPLPGVRIDSIYRISPPTSVQASPVTTPTMPPTSYSSLWKRGTPRIFSTSAAVTSGLNCSSKPMFFARVRTIFAMFLSSARTPDSRVYSPITFSITFGPILNCLAGTPCASSCFGIRCLRAICILSSRI